MLRIGIIREEKNPPDSRVPLNPSQCRSLMDKGVEISVQSSPSRCFSDEEYKKAGVPVVDDVSNMDVLIGVKEVPKASLIADKTYFFFSHTIKEQPYNRSLLQEIVRKNIRLIDYEVLTDEKGKRVIAFGKWAGMVGAHNAIWTYGKRTGLFELPRMCDLHDYEEALTVYKSLDLPPMCIALTGTGRVSGGAAKVLEAMGIQKVRPIDYITQKYDSAIFTQLSSFYYAKRKDGREFDDVRDFYSNPEKYESDFYHYLPITDVMINGIYWDNDAPAFFTKEQMRRDDFRIKVIGDVTCDIAPVSSIPSTLHASTIADPVFGYDPQTEAICDPYQEHSIDMMTIDNLPNELPRDASTAFGDKFLRIVIPQLLADQSPMLDKASVVRDKDLGPHFEYLRGYLEGE